MAPVSSRCRLSINAVGQEASLATHGIRVEEGHTAEEWRWDLLQEVLVEGWGELVVAPASLHLTHRWDKRSRSRAGLLPMRRGSCILSLRWFER